MHTNVHEHCIGRKASLGAISDTRAGMAAHCAVSQRSADRSLYPCPPIQTPTVVRVSVFSR
jgi:hypothetical protein